MVKKRIIPCLDIKDGRTVKGVNFINLIDAGDPVELAKRYAQEGADELVFLDITATENKRKTILEWVEKVAEQIHIPFTVGGGISSVEDAYAILRAGADKITINSSAVKTPQLVKELSNRFGNQCVVCAIDAKKINQQWKVFIQGGKIETDLELFSWAKELEKLGAGEILYTCMNQDGTKEGFDIEGLKKLNETLNIPVIASGGAGKKEDFKNVFLDGKADAALAASVFHFSQIPIPDLKDYLNDCGILTRKLR